MYASVAVDAMQCNAMWNVWYSAITTLKVMLILFPHLTRNSISPLVSLSCLMWHHCTHSQFTYSIGKRPLKVRQFVIVIVVVVVVVICLNILRVILSDEVMKCCKCRWKEGLDIYVVHQRMVEHSKMPLDDPKDPLCYTLWGIWLIGKSSCTEDKMLTSQ